MMREREIKNLPGGYLENPPAECQRQVTYKPPGHKAIQIVDYVICGRCPAKKCATRDEADRGKRTRIRNMREGLE